MLEANTRLDKAIDLGNHELIDQALFDTMRLNSEYLHEQNRTHWDEPNYYNQPRLNDDADATRVDKQRHPNMKDIPNNNYGDWDGFYDY